MKKVIIISIVLTALTVAVNAQTNGWVIQSSPTTQSLRGITSKDANTWIAVGDGGTIIRSSDAGINWTAISSPVTDALHGVSFRGNIGIVAGFAGRIIRTTDGGLNWVQLPRPTTRDLYCASMSDVMAVIMGHEGTILVSTDNGQTWAPHGAGTASVLFGVSVNGSFAVGVGGQGAVVMSVDGGSGWGLTVIGNQLTFFYSTSFVNASTGWLVGSAASTGSVIAKSTDFGFVWTGQTSPTTEQLFGVSFAAIDTGTAVGTNGVIIHTMNGGTSWSIQTSGTTQILNGVSFNNSNFGIAVGNAGTILRTTNGGLSGIHRISNELPMSYSLLQNYPNPFNPSTNIRFSVPKNSTVKLTVYDMLGREVETLVNENLEPGTYNVRVDASGLSSGTYFYRLKSSDFTDTRKFVLLK